MNQPRSIMPQLIGSALMLLGAVLYSSKAVIVKLAYRYDIDAISLLALRMLFALPFYVLILWWVSWKETAEPLGARDWWRIVGIGITGYYLASMFDFHGLRFISAGLERLILFVYPTLVVLILAIGYRKRISGVTLLALALTYAGIGLAFFNDPSSTSSDQLYLGGGLVFLAALSYAFYIVWSAGLVQRIGTLRFTAIGMIAACMAILIHHGLSHGLTLGHYPGEVYGLALLMAVLATVLPSFLVMEAIRRIGPTRSAIIGSIGPISTIVLAYYFLSESFTGLQLLGTGIVIAGVLLISLAKKKV